MNYLLPLLILLSAHTCLSAQTFKRQDSLGISIEKADTMINNRPVYDVTIYNHSHTPIGILHSWGMFLLEDLPPQYVPLYETNDTAIYHLKCATRDTIPDHIRCDQFNAAIVLPFQALHLQLTLAPSHKTMLLRFERIRIPDFCYQDLLKAIFDDSYDWYKAYRRVPFSVVIPQ